MAKFLIVIFKKCVNMLLVVRLRLTSYKTLVKYLRLGLKKGSRPQINQYGFFEANTDIYAIHGPIPIFPKIFKSYFLRHYQKRDAFYALPFFQKLKKIRIYELNFSKLQQFQCLAAH